MYPFFYEIKEDRIIKQNNKQNNSNELVNEQIPEGEVLLIDHNGKNCGLTPTKEALKIAEEQNLDLVVVSGDKKPLVAKIIDYPKYKYDLNKKLKEIKKNQNIIQVKEIRLGPTIQTNDLNVKINMAKRFITKGDKVKLSMRLRGRMIEHAPLGLELMNKFIVELSELVSVETKPTLEGNFINAVLAPTKKK